MRRLSGNYIPWPRCCRALVFNGWGKVILFLSHKAHGDNEDQSTTERRGLRRSRMRRSSCCGVDFLAVLAIQVSGVPFRARANSFTRRPFDWLALKWDYRMELIVVLAQ
jgi:hypothetical protein